VIRFMEKAQRRLRNEESGFTLIELLIVLVIIGILLAIAVPSYLGFRDRANQRAAAANVRAAIPAAEAYYADNGNYTGVTVATLELIDAGLSLNTASGTAATYTLCSQVGNRASTVTGPGGAITDVPAGTC